MKISSLPLIAPEGWSIDLILCLEISDHHNFHPILKGFFLYREVH